MVEEMGKYEVEKVSCFLKEFVTTYVNCALNKLRESPTMDVFDDYVREEVSEILDIPCGLVKRLHKPFHWELFCEGGDLAEYAQPSENGKKTFVRLKRAYSVEDMDEINQSILEKYGKLLDAKYEVYLKERGIF